MSKKKDHKNGEPIKAETNDTFSTDAELLKEAMENSDKSSASTDTPETNATKTNTPDETGKETMETLKIELTSANDRYLRLMAEFDNYKKRTARDYLRMVESANEKLMSEMIEVREAFERALKHGETATDYTGLFDGVKLIFNKFDGVLSANGLASFTEKGDLFDPQIHDALMKTPHEEISEDYIAEIYEKGYRLKDRVIKHAKVIVSSGKKK